MVNRTALSAAKEYSSRGLYVFPCRHGQKTPATTNGLKDASRDPGQLGDWFANGQQNIAIATGQQSGVAVIDVDTYAGGDLSSLEFELGNLPATLEAKTRAGGRHLFFRYPLDTVLRSLNGQIAPHVDLKAQGGYVIAAPSWVDKDAKGPAGFYEWLNNQPIADLPHAWRDRWASLGSKASPHKNTGTAKNEFAVTGGYQIPAQVAAGQRNTELLRYSGHLRSKGMPEALIIEAARDFNRARCIPPVDDAELVDVAQRYATSDGTCSDEWPEPKPIELALPDVKPFDTKLLPETFRLFVEDQAELMQIAPDFIATPLMVAAAAAIGNGITIAPKANDVSWIVPTILWGGVVGRPGMLKSPAIAKAMHPLSVIESEMQEQFEARRQNFNSQKVVYEAALKKAKSDLAKGHATSIPAEPEEPKPERILVNDSTMQMLGEIQRHSPRGVLVMRDELVSLLETLGADGQEGARGYYLEGWNGISSYRVDRIGRGSFIIQRHALWVFGGIQPGRLQAYIRQAVNGGNGDDGLLQRFQMIVWPDTAKDWQNIDRVPDFEAMQAVDDSFLRLRHLDPVAIGAHVDPVGKRPAYLHFNSEAQEEFDAFRLKLETSVRTGDKHPALESHLSKYRSLVPTLALVIHLADGGTGPVTRDALRKAIWWSNYLWSHARRVYASVTNAAAFGAKALANKVTEGKLTNGFTAREVQRHGWQSLTTPDDVRNALEWLVDAGWLRINRVTNSEGGRPTETYTINPKVGLK
jgi:hypothetical protein